MTDDYCDSNESCCGGSPDAIKTSGYNVECDPDKHTCDNGQSCNPPGNICGASTDVNASQNCCGGKKDVCKADSSGILRCFGGPPEYCNANGCSDSSPCPTGYDPTNPLCCIEPGDVCQFADQCCNGMPCVPDSSGTLRCGGGAPSSDDWCNPIGTRCAGDGDQSCCEGLSCAAYGENGMHACLPPGASPTCKLTGGACTGAADCCSGSCVEGYCGDYTQPGGSDGSGSCMTSSQSCTVNGDCCAGLSCAIPAGATHGTCEAASVCAETTQSCSGTVPCCSATDTCTGGVCLTPASCVSESFVCTSDESCCSGACMTSDASGNLVPCTTGSTCSCQQPCVEPGLACDASHPCCNGTCTGGYCPNVAPR
jgi:hypothetical protein